MLLSAILVLASAFLVSAIFGCGLYFFISAFAVIVLNIEILSLFGAISPLGILSINFVTFLATLVFWLRAGRPLLALKVNFKKYFNAIKLDKSLLFLSLGFLVLMFSGFILAAVSPVNDPDAQAYHGLRAIVFAQQGSLAHFQIADIRNIVMPINSEIFYCWIYSLTGRDLGFGLFSYFSYLLGLASLWGILSHYKYSLRKKLWCVFILSSLAGVISQISSTQTDVAVGALFLAALCFLLRQDKGLHYTYFATLALALALGTKSTAAIMLLPFLILFLRRNFKMFFLFLILNFFIFSSYNYILNFIDFQNPLGSVSSIEMHRFVGGYKAFVANFIRYITQFLDFAGFTWGYYLNDTILGAQVTVLKFLHIPQDLGVVAKMDEVNSFLTEQTVGFGILGFFLFLPCAVCALFFRRLRPFGAFFFLTLLMLSASLCYMVFSIRFITAFVMLAAPVLTLSYCKKMNLFKFIVVLFAVFYLTLVSTHLAQRPYFKLLNLYKTSGSFEDFTDKIRCSDAPFYVGHPQGCMLRDYTRSIGAKNVAFFSDAHFPLLPMKLDNANVDALLLEGLDGYDISKYDTIILPYSFQISNYDFKNRVFHYDIVEKNGVDEVHFTSDNAVKCIFYDRNNAPTKSGNIIFSRCYINKQYFINKGFQRIQLIDIAFSKIYKNEKNSFYVFKKL